MYVCVHACLHINDVLSWKNFRIKNFEFVFIVIMTYLFLNNNICVVLW